jgi:transposase
MRSASAQLPDDIEALKRLVLEREAQLEIARHNERAHLTLIEHLKLQIARLKRMQFGRSSEKLNADRAARADRRGSRGRSRPARARSARAGRRPPGSNPVRRPLPEHLPRETVRHEPEPAALSAAAI